MRNQKGVTLIECVVVFAVLTIVGSITYIPLKNMIVRMQVRGDVADIVCNLNRARLAAVKHHSSIVADFTSSRSYSIFIDNGNFGGIRNDWKRQSGETEIIASSYKRGIDVTSNFHLPQDKVRFNPRGCMKGGSLTVETKNGGNYKIIVNSTGRVRVERI